MQEILIGFFFFNVSVVIWEEKNEKRQYFWNVYVCHFTKNCICTFLFEVSKEIWDINHSLQGLLRI